MYVCCETDSGKMYQTAHSHLFSFKSIQYALHHLQKNPPFDYQPHMKEKQILVFFFLCIC